MVNSKDNIRFSTIDAFVSIASQNVLSGENYLFIRDMHIFPKSDYYGEGIILPDTFYSPLFVSKYQLGLTQINHIKSAAN